MRKVALSVLGVCLPAMISPLCAAPMSDAERASLQAVMVQHIDRTAIDGLYKHVDLGAGRVVEYAPAKSHPMILRFGDNFVLCTEFKTPDGKAANVDFYVARAGKAFTVIQTEIDNREPLMKLMASGKVAPVD